MLRRSVRPLRPWRLVLLGAGIVLLTYVHQFGDVQRSPFHEILDVAPYVLILLGALWYGLAGGIACALLTTFCYTTHLVLHEGGALFGENLHRTLNIAMFSVVGLVAGHLAQRQVEAARSYRRAAEELETSHAELRRRTEELLRTEEHLRRANRLSMLGELTAGLAHEVGNPLGGIKGIAEILADHTAPGGPDRRLAQLLLAEVERLDSVVSRFLESVRPQECREEQADLKAVFSTAVSLCSPSLRSGGLECRLELEEDLPPVAADPRLLGQVFLNLLLNAIQATPTGGRITLSARRAGGAAECRVEDTGPGIAAEDLPRLFDPFFTTRPGGTGLGLAIAYRILEGCGGGIEVGSRAPRGAVFTVRLPVHEGARAVAARHRRG